MSLLTRDELEALMAETEGPFVSIFMPAYRAGPEIQEGPIRLKNLLNQAQERLTETGLRVPEARELLKPAWDVLEQGEFWQQQLGGLAMFISPKLFRVYRLPLQFEDFLLVSNRFHLKPLLPLLTGDGQFYILALSQDQIRLLQGTRDTIRELELEDVPESLAEALRYDDFEKPRKFYTNAMPMRNSGQGGLFHGHTAVKEDEKNILWRYFQQVDRGLNDLLQNQKAPLVLAGVEYLFPIYREASSYQHLVEDGIKGNPEELSDKELHQWAWTLVEPIFQQDRQKAVELFNELINNSDQASGNLEEVVPAAYYGRVGTMFVAVGLEQWGSFNPDTAELQLHQEPQPGDEELLDAAAARTLLNSGKVFAVEPEKVPGGGPVAAIFRY
jgi:hypothetical protein